MTATDRSLRKPASCAAACILVLAALAMPCLAATDSWSTGGPFADPTVDTAVYSLAVTADGSILFAGFGNGSVFSRSIAITFPPTTTTTPAPGSFSIGSSPVNGGSDSSDGGAGGATSNTGNLGGQQGNNGAQYSPLEGQSTPVNVGGSTPVISATVYGNGNSGAVITATAVDGPPAGVSPPAGSTVYSYLEISTVGTGTLNGAEITFTVSQSWLDEHHMNMEDVVMYHYTGGQWVALPTIVLKTANGQVYFNAVTPSFSRFAIGARINPLASATQTPVQSFGDMAGTSASPLAGSARQAGAGFPAAEPQPATAASVPVQTEPGFPLVTVALIGAGCVTLAGTGWWVRRWWIRRQNPALFMEYD